MTHASNKQVRLTSRPSGIPQREHFEIVEAPVPEPDAGQVLIRNVFLSVEPAMRGWVSSEANYAEPVPIGSVMRSFTVGRVVKSCHPDYQSGEFVTGLFGWQDYAVVDAMQIERRISDTEIPVSTALGVLGLNGMTAYLALLDIGQPRPGETVLVSTAAGAVGSCVGQIAKIQGCRTVGLTSSADKMRLCREVFGFDAAIDYRADDLDSRIAQACPQGIDVYFDNTGGEISDVVMRHLATGARVVICGTASVENWAEVPLGPRVERTLLVKRACMQGFVIFDHAPRFDEARKALTGWIKTGQIRYREDVLDGIEHAPDAIAGLYRGENLGKRLIRIADPHSN